MLQGINANDTIRMFMDKAGPWAALAVLAMLGLVFVLGFGVWSLSKFIQNLVQLLQDANKQVLTVMTNHDVHFQAEREGFMSFQTDITKSLTLLNTRMEDDHREALNKLNAIEKAQAQIGRDVLTGGKDKGTPDV